MSPIILKCFSTAGHLNAGSPQHRENRENGQIHSLSGKTQEIWKFCQNTGKFVCTSCKFPDSNGKGYCDICHENFHVFFLKLVCLQSQFYVHKSCELTQGKCAVRQGKNRENTGNLKILFEWGPCITLHLTVYISSPSFCLCLQIILKVYLDAAATRVTEVPITPHTTVGDVLQCCREPGEETCHLAELWRGIGE